MSAYIELEKIYLTQVGNMYPYFALLYEESCVLTFGHDPLMLLRRMLYITQ